MLDKTYVLIRSCSSGPIHVSCKVHHYGNTLVLRPCPTHYYLLVLAIKMNYSQLATAMLGPLLFSSEIQWQFHS